MFFEYRRWGELCKQHGLYKNFDLHSKMAHFWEFKDIDELKNN